jgi:hypothetical protein
MTAPRPRLGSHASATEGQVNRTAMVMVLSACCFVVAVVALPLAIQRSTALAPRVLAATLIPLGLGLATLARSMIARLRPRSER